MCALQGLGERIQALNKEVFGGVLSSEQLQQLESSEAKQVSHHHIYYVTSSDLELNAHREMGPVRDRKPLPVDNTY